MCLVRFRLVGFLEHLHCVWKHRLVTRSYQIWLPRYRHLYALKNCRSSEIRSVPAAAENFTEFWTSARIACTPKRSSRGNAPPRCSKWTEAPKRWSISINTGKDPNWRVRWAGSRQDVWKTPASSRISSFPLRFTGSVISSAATIRQSFSAMSSGRKRESPSEIFWGGKSGRDSRRGSTENSESEIYIKLFR